MGGLLAITLIRREVATSLCPDGESLFYSALGGSVILTPVGVVIFGTRRIGRWEKRCKLLWAVWYSECANFTVLIDGMCNFPNERCEYSSYSCGVRISMSGWGERHGLIDSRRGFSRYEHRDIWVRKTQWFPCEIYRATMWIYRGTHARRHPIRQRLVANGFPMGSAIQMASLLYWLSRKLVMRTGKFSLYNIIHGYFLSSVYLPSYFKAHSL